MNLLASYARYCSASASRVAVMRSSPCRVLKPGGGQRRHLDLEVEPVEHRTGDARGVLSELGRRARAALPGVTEEPTRTGVLRGDKHGPAGKDA
jgi:hypothetical protein